MNGMTLDPQELLALREAFQAGEPEVPSGALPVALLRERLVDRAKPGAMALGARWAGLAGPALARGLGAPIEIQVSGVEQVSGNSLRDELDGAWLVGLTARGQEAILAVSGPLIVAAAVRWLSGRFEPIGERRASPAALRLFSSLGRAIEEALRRAWLDVLGETLNLVPAKTQAPGFFGPMTSLLLTTEGEAQGKIRLIAPPQMLQERSALVPPPNKTSTDALSEVPVELSIELGRTKITLAELAALRPGDVLTLGQSLSEPLLVHSSGIQAAHCKVLLKGEALHVEVVPSPQQAAPARKESA